MPTLGALCPVSVDAEGIVHCRIGRHRGKQTPALLLREVVMCSRRLVKASAGLTWRQHSVEWTRLLGAGYCLLYTYGIRRTCRIQMCSLLCDATFVPWSERMEPYRDDAKQAGKRPARLAGNTVARFSPSCDAPGGTTTLSVAVWLKVRDQEARPMQLSQAIAIINEAKIHAVSSWLG